MSRLKTQVLSGRQMRGIHLKTNTPETRHTDQEECLKKRVGNRACKSLVCTQRTTYADKQLKNNLLFMECGMNKQ